MTPIQPYLPAFLQFNAHFQTIIPSVFRKVKDIHYFREKITTPDDDFLNLDWCYSKNSSKSTQKSLVILSHGLEGDSNRQYIKGMVKIFTENGFDCLAWNFRSCGGEINKQLKFYHSGATDDLHLVVQHALSKNYEAINLIGFSLGGNLTLKYLGERETVSPIKKSIVFSVPLDLAKSSQKIALPANWVYTKRFLRSLKKKIIQKANFYPNHLNVEILRKIKTVEDFDEYFTSKLHGFINAKDYYAKNSSIIFVEKISIPTLIINAKNDPFLAKECFPYELLEGHEFVKLETPEKGGHCGFWQKGYQNFLWSEIRALQHIEN